MSDLTKRSYGGQTAGLQGDVERGLARLRSDLKADSIKYVPGDPNDWVEPLPETVAEALDRLAAAAGANPVP